MGTRTAKLHVVGGVYPYNQKTYYVVSPLVACNLDFPNGWDFNISNARIFSNAETAEAIAKLITSRNVETTSSFLYQDVRAFPLYTPDEEVLVLEPNEASALIMDAAAMIGVNTDNGSGTRGVIKSFLFNKIHKRDNFWNSLDKPIVTARSIDCKDDELPTEQRKYME